MNEILNKIIKSSNVFQYVIRNRNTSESKSKIYQNNYLVILNR